MTIVFTKTDKALLDRAARHLQSRAKSLVKLHEGHWSLTKEAKAAKLEFDRLLRDERDLRALARLLEKASKAAEPVAKVVTLGQGNG